MTGTQRSVDSLRWGRVVVFDCVFEAGEDIRGRPWWHRNGVVCKRMGAHPAAKVHRASYWSAQSDEGRLYSDYVQVRDRRIEGIVYIDSQADYYTPIGKCKPRHEVDYVCMGTNPAGRALMGGLIEPDGQLTQVASVAGLTRDERDDIAEHPDRYIGRVFTAAGSGVFKSGKLRSPTFAGWHADKPAASCLADGRGDV